MRRLWGRYTGLAAALVAAVSATAGLAVAEKPTQTVAGNPLPIFNAGFTPSKLPKTKPTPTTFSFSMKLRTGKDVHPPALTKLVLEGDRHARVSVKGIPTVKDVPGCSSGRERRRDSRAVRKACGPALVGSGQAEAQVQFPEEPPVDVQSELLALNGGVKNGMTTLYLHTFFSAPVTAEVVTTVKVKRIRRGRYGWEAIATVPKIAGGAGSITLFNLTLEKGIVSATCPIGRLDTRIAGSFSDGTHRRETIIRACTAQRPRPQQWISDLLPVEHLEIDVGFTPARMSATQRTPVTLEVSETLSTEDGSHLKPAQEATSMLRSWVNTASPTEVWIPIELGKAEGIYDLKATASIPKLAGGSCSLIHLRLRVRKGFFSATCPRRHLRLSVLNRFLDGMLFKGSLLRRCDR
jgi:hypothetical protein